MLLGLRSPASRIVPKATYAVQNAPALSEQLMGARKIAVDMFAAIESKGIASGETSSVQSAQSPRDTSLQDPARKHARAM